MKTDEASGSHTLRPGHNPSPGGRSFQGRPVFNPKKMPVGAWRFSGGLRPKQRKRRGMCAGNNGSTRFHNSSSTSGLLLSSLPHRHAWRVRLKTSFKFRS